MNICVSADVRAMSIAWLGWGGVDWKLFRRDIVGWGKGMVGGNYFRETICENS